MQLFNADATIFFKKLKKKWMDRAYLKKNIW